MASGCAGDAGARGGGVAEAVLLVVAGGAGDRVVARKPLVVEKHAAEGRAEIGDFVAGGGVVLGDVGGDGLVRVVFGAGEIEGFLLREGGNGEGGEKDEGFHGCG